MDKLYQFLDDHHLIGSVVRPRQSSLQTEQFRPLTKMQILIPTTTVHTNNNSNKIFKVHVGNDRNTRNEHAVRRTAPGLGPPRRALQNINLMYILSFEDKSKN